MFQQQTDENCSCAGRRLAATQRSGYIWRGEQELQFELRKWLILQAKVA
jgi:hypothetical protein